VSLPAASMAGHPDLQNTSYAACCGCIMKGVQVLNDELLNAVGLCKRVHGLLSYS